MTDLSWSHIVLVLVVALAVVGPKDLPKLARTVGQWMAKARQMAGQLRVSFDEMTRQAELDDLRRELEALRAHQAPVASPARPASSQATAQEPQNATSRPSKGPQLP